MTPSESAATHDWAIPRIPIRAAGLLTEPEQTRLLAHLAECESCREQMERLVETAADEAHVPSTVLARFDREAPRLRGLLRTLTRVHLERCVTCRAELEALGFTAELPWVSELEETPPESASASRHSEVGDAVAHSTRSRRQERSRAQVLGAAWGWRLGVAASIILAVAIWLPLKQRVPSKGALSPTPPRESRTPSQEGGEVANTTPNAEPLLALLSPGESAVALPETYRDSESGPDVTEIPFDARLRAWCVLPPQALAASLGARVDIALRGESGPPVRTLATELDSLFTRAGPVSIAILRGDPPLAPGRYTIEFTVRDPAGQVSEVSRHALRLR